MTDRLLPGEPEDSRNLEDVMVWVGVYRDLTTSPQRFQVSDEQRALYRGRLNFWKVRLAEALQRAGHTQVVKERTTEPAVSPDEVIS